MGIPIGELQQRVSSREFAEYYAFSQLEPFGPEREDLRSAIVARTVAEVNRDRKKRPRPYDVAEFMPSLVQAELAPDDEDDEELSPLAELEAEAVEAVELEARIDATFAQLAGGQP